MNKRGSITVEAMLVIGVLLLVFASIFQMFRFVQAEEIMAQEVYDGIEDVAIVNYLLHKIGPFDEAIFRQVAAYLPDEQQAWIAKVPIEKVADLGMTAVLQQTLILSLDAPANVSHIKGETFSLDGDILNLMLSYEINTLGGKKLKRHLRVKKRLWLFGNEPDQFQQTTLADFFQQEHDVVVYVTKSGTKYHLKNCFYIRRSTTDHKAVQGISLAEAMKHFSPCKRCILKEVELWK